MGADVTRLLEENLKLAADRSQWNQHFQLVAEYVLQRKATFTIHEEPGAFIHSEVWTDVPAKAAETAASALLGLLWPDSFSFALDPSKDLAEDDEVRQWFEDATETLQDAMDDPEAGLALALDEFMIDFLVFGTPAIHCEEGDKSDLKFDAWNVSQFYIDEGTEGYVDIFHKNFSYTVRQAVNRFGLEKLSKKTQDLYKNKKYMEKVKFLHAIYPRDVDPKGGKGPQNMPYASVYIEVDGKHLVRESGFHELPTFAARYSKRIGEKYGRSPAMRALPSIMELNAIWEMVTLGIEKNYDPPLAVYDDGTFGGGTIDTSAGAINVLNVSGKLNSSRSPIEPIFTVGNFNDVSVLIERLENTIGDHFMIDILLDLNNEKDMTAAEYLGRAAIRQKATRSPVNRLISELFNRMIERSFNILYRKGRFGYPAGSPEMMAAQAAGQEVKTIPEAIVNMQGSNKRVYTIRYLTPAAREQQAEEAQGILNWYQFIGSVAQYDQTILDIPNHERSEKRLGEIWSVPEECRNTKEELKAIRDQKAQAANQQAEMETAEKMAGVAKDAAMAQNAGQGSTTQNLQ